MNIVEEIKESWGWVGIDPVEVVGENDFGNLLIKDSDGKYWRLCPEDVDCEVVMSGGKIVEIFEGGRVKREKIGLIIATGSSGR